MWGYYSDWSRSVNVRARLQLLDIGQILRAVVSVARSHANHGVNSRVRFNVRDAVLLTHAITSATAESRPSPRIRGM